MARYSYYYVGFGWSNFFSYDKHMVVLSSTLCAIVVLLWCKWVLQYGSYTRTHTHKRSLSQIIQLKNPIFTVKMQLNLIARTKQKCYDVYCGDIPPKLYSYAMQQCTLHESYRVICVWFYLWLWAMHMAEKSWSFRVSSKCFIVWFGTITIFVEICSLWWSLDL